MPATVVKVLVAMGATIRRGEPLLVLEAMKMELIIRAPRDGVVTAVHCREGDLVQPERVLIDLAESPN
jgi:3-methylcrotonyl-CoA carboxylase alpha subunit